MKNTSMSKSVESLEYITYYSLSSSRPVKDPMNSTKYSTTIRRSSSEREDLKPYWKSEKGHISLHDQQSYYLQVVQRLY